ncbi:MAG: ATP-binding protein [Pseudomonadota bacterium]
MSLKPASCEVESSLDQLETLITCVQSRARMLSLPASLIHRVELIVEELFVNVVHHGRPPPEAIVTVVLERPTDSADLQLEVRDCGRAFNPLADAPEADISSDLQARHPGGLGVYLVQQLARHQQYARVGGQNVLTLLIPVPE